MKHRSIAAVVILTLITFGIYGIYWAVVTAREMRKLGANIPNAILIIVPIANLYWTWRYSEGVDKVTNGKWSAPLVFILFILTGIGGIVLGQVAFNEDVSATPQAASESGGLSGQATTAIPGVGAPAAVGGAVGAASQPTEPASADSATTVASADTSQTTETPTDSSSVSESSDLSTSPEVESTADSATASEEPATTEASSDSSKPTETTPSEPTTPVSSEPVSPPSSSDDNQNTSIG